MNVGPDHQAKEGGRGRRPRQAMKRSGLQAVLFVVAAAAGLSAGAQQALQLTPEENELLALTNQERKKKQLPPLRPNSRLLQVARAHAANMARQSKIEHTLDGRTPPDRLRAVDYRFATGGENIAKGEATVALPAILKAWMQSQRHRENILLAEFTEIGLGLARDSAGQIYYAQVFARPQSSE
jgi:uncharacterized protein YkwD